jgi:hypothetical protein
VAEKSVGAGARASSAPITSSEVPYMGDESTRRPPAAKNARRMSPRTRRAALSAPPTSNVIQVPSPTTGIFSPVEGTARAWSAGACAIAGSIAAAPIPPRNRIASRRSIKSSSPKNNE